MKQLISIVFLLLLNITTSHAQPEKVWATYYGDGAQSIILGTDASSVVYDSTGFIYVSGFVTDSTINLATPNSFKMHMSGTYGAMGAYLAKFDTLGYRIWSTYLGNDDATLQPTITLDKDKNIIVTGLTQGQQNLIGTPNTFNPVPPPSSWSSTYGYVIKFNSNGNRIWGTYLRNGNMGTTSFFPNSITSDNSGNILIGGFSAGGNNYTFPSSNTFMPTSIDSLNGFVLKLDPNGAFVWGTYLGGEGQDLVDYIVCNSVGELYVVGATESNNNIATLGTSYQNYTGNGGTGINDYESFITKLGPNGNRIWGTYTNGIMAKGGLVINKNNEIYIAGTAKRDTGIATNGTYQQDYKDSTDFCLSKWNANGQKIWGTYYGGNSEEFYNGWTIPWVNYSSFGMCHSITLDAAENILIVGGTKSKTDIKVGCTYYNTELIEPTGFMAKFYPSGQIFWGSYFDVPISAVAASNTGTSFYLTAFTTADNLATPGAFQTNKTNYGYSGYIVKMTGDYICPSLDIDISKQNDSLLIFGDFHDFKWYHNGTLLTDSSSLLIPEDSGNYYAVFKNNCDCIYTSDTVFVDLPTGINSIEGNPLNMSLFPNPNNGKFQLVGTFKNDQQELEYALTDLPGRILASGILKANGQGFKQDLNFSELSPGIYLLKIKSGGEQFTMKWIKTK